MAAPLIEYLRQRIQTYGPLSFRDFMEAVLYHPQHGYYSSDRNPLGKEGDFYTSADVDPILGELLSRKFAEMASDLGVDAGSFTIVELGAGRGLLARDILAHHRFPYRILERSTTMRARQREALRNYDVEWIKDLPKDLVGCVFSNEFFDALPVHRLVRREGLLREIYVTENFTEVEGDPQVPFDVPITNGQIADINVDAKDWLLRVAASLKRGYHLTIDYGYLEREFYARPRGTLMCYWRHQAGEDPYIRLGEQDITAHVNFSDLIDTGRTAGLEMVDFSTQMDFLIRCGILREMESLALASSAAAIQRMLAIKNLILPSGMGERFKVLVQRKL